MIKADWPLMTAILIFIYTCLKSQMYHHPINYTAKCGLDHPISADKDTCCNLHTWKKLDELILKYIQMRNICLQNLGNTVFIT